MKDCTRSRSGAQLGMAVPHAQRGYLCRSIIDLLRNVGGEDCSAERV